MKLRLELLLAIAVLALMFAKPVLAPKPSTLPTEAVQRCTEYFIPIEAVTVPACHWTVYRF